MKLSPTLLAVLLAAGLLLTGCKDEEPNYKKDNGETPEPPRTSGYVDVSSLALHIVTDPETITSQTRAEEEAPDTNDFSIAIYDAADAKVREFRYAEKPATAIELPAGSYTLKAISGEIPEAGWDTPAYAGERFVAIEREKTVSVTDLTCTLANIKVSVEYPAEISGQLGEDTKAEVTIGANTLTIAKDETRAAYFKAPALTNSLSLKITGSLGQTPIDIQETIEGVKAGQWRKICPDIVIESQPEIVWKDYDIDQRYDVVENMVIEVSITAGSGISGLTVDITGTPEFIQALEDMQLGQHLDLVNPGATEEMLKTLGFPTGEDAKQKSVSFDISEFIPLLSMFGDGDYDFKITVTDNSNNTTIKTLMFRVGATPPDPGTDFPGGDIEDF